MGLTDRDIRILTSLRFGIMKKEYILHEHFSASEIANATPSFQKLVNEQVHKASIQFSTQNQALIDALHLTCDNYAQSSLAVLIAALSDTTKRYGKHLDKELNIFLQWINRLILQQSLHTADIPSLMETELQEAAISHAQKRQERNAQMLCHKVMKRLIRLKLVRELPVIEARNTLFYYHLTKQYGIPLVTEIMFEKNSYVKVLGHNYAPIHAKHDAMVSMTLKTLLNLATVQGYSIHAIYDESEQKSIFMRKINYNKTRYKKKKFYTDICLDISLDAKPQLQTTRFQIEID